MMEWVKANPRPTAFILWGGAVFVLLVAILHSCADYRPSNVIIAPVGSWSEPVPIPPGYCVKWERRRPDDHFLTELRDKTTGQWFRQPTSGYPNADAARFMSSTQKPAEVVILQQQYPC